MTDVIKNELAEIIKTAVSKFNKDLDDGLAIDLAEMEVSTDEYFEVLVKGSADYGLSFSSPETCNNGETYLPSTVKLIQYNGCSSPRQLGSSFKERESATVEYKNNAYTITAGLHWKVNTEDEKIEVIQNGIFVEQILTADEIEAQIEKTLDKIKRNHSPAMQLLFLQDIPA